MLAQFFLYFLLDFLAVALFWAAIRLFPNSKTLAFFCGMAGLALFLAFTYFAYRWNTIGEAGSFEAQRSAARRAARESLAAEANATLSQPGWIDAEKGLVRIPIGEAMRMELAALKAKKVAAAYPVNPPPEPTPANPPSPSGDTAPSHPPAPGSAGQAPAPAPGGGS
jgi:hypothetical protein